MSPISTVTTSSSVSPIARPSLRTFSARPPGSSRLRRLALLLAVDDRGVQHAQPLERARGTGARPLRELEEQRLDRVGDRGRGRAVGQRDGLDRATFGDLVEELLVRRGQAGVVGDRLHQGLDDLGVEDRAPRRHLAHGPGQLVALAHPVLQQVGVPGGAVPEEGDGVVRVVVLREHDDPGARVPLAQLLGRVDALPLEARGHADVGDEHLRGRRLRAREQAVVVVRGADHVEVRLEREQTRGRPRGRSRCRRRGTR